MEIFDTHCITSTLFYINFEFNLIKRNKTFYAFYTYKKKKQPLLSGENNVFHQDLRLKTIVKMKKRRTSVKLIHLSFRSKLRVCFIEISI